MDIHSAAMAAEYRGDHEHAMRLLDESMRLGRSLDDVLGMPLAPSLHLRFERMVERVRQALSGAALEAAWAE